MRRSHFQSDWYSDSELLVGGPEEFAEVYRRHASAVLAWVYKRTFDPATAADITAETFAQALRTKSRFRKEADSARPWLLGIARHVLASYHRRNRLESSSRRRLGMPVRELDPESYRRIEELVDAEAMRAHLARALEGIPRRSREAIELRVVMDLPYDEVARRLNCTEGAARVRVSRGLARLHSLMEETQ